MYQIVIPDKLSEERYISGIHALNLPAPEGTSGDWHFSSVFYRDSDSRASNIVMIAGNGERFDTNQIFGNYGIYNCNKTLENVGLKAQGEISYAANHYRAILDLLYEEIKNGNYPSYLQRITEDYLDTEEEKNILLEKVNIMLPYLSLNEREMLHKWIEEERKPGYRS